MKYFRDCGGKTLGIKEDESECEGTVGCVV